MGSYFQALLFIILAVILLWFGYNLFWSLTGGKSRGKRRKTQKKSSGEGVPGAPRTCPVCSARLERGERVKSAAFPSMGGTDRLMHISGCVYCLEGERQRKCPVCGHALKPEEILIARMFDKPGRSHVHVIGCSRCRGPRSKR
ncbi:hypothetical protein [Breznakiella homolactica]|uniref:Uncharacterized protein n=1 Tax=Breznakiella homolactica TaxID=2798577 RepID=A0A7T7XPR2_9SPIR|nr:hypothetical protein [Breznakiella homolactica]QQO10226.1 hypothetical protein JFL75_04705 [Breznakiella homolactica]